MPKTYNRAFHVFLTGAHKKWNKCKLYSLKLNSNVTWLIAVYIESIKMESERKKKPKQSIDWCYYKLVKRVEEESRYLSFFC